jgi:aconitate hydratase
MGAIIEYTGPGVESLSCAGMATICIMGTEIGATTFFPFNKCKVGCLGGTGRPDIGQYTNKFTDNLWPDEGVEYD